MVVVLIIGRVTHRIITRFWELRETQMLKLSNELSTFSSVPQQVRNDPLTIVFPTYSRKATLKAHPDKEGGSEEKMASLNQAYEVISNPGTSSSPPIIFALMY